MNSPHGEALATIAVAKDTVLTQLAATDADFRQAVQARDVAPLRGCSRNKGHACTWDLLRVHSSSCLNRIDRHFSEVQLATESSLVSLQQNCLSHAKHMTLVP